MSIWMVIGAMGLQRFGYALLVTAVLAQQAQADADTSTVTPFPTSYFAASQANTAFEMISRIPGFTYDEGSQVRGFGAGGNVLIDGERPTSKADSLESILRRISIGQVERIDLIRGAASGIDMQGRTVLLNVIRRKGIASGTIAVGNDSFQDGRQAPIFRIEGRKADGAHSLEASLFANRYVDKSAGNGSRVRRDRADRLLDQANYASVAGGDYVSLSTAIGLPLLGGKAALNGGITSDQYHSELNDRVSTEPHGVDQNDTNRDLKGEIGLRYTRPLSDGARLETVGIQQWDTQQYRSRVRGETTPADFVSDTDKSETIMRGELHWAGNKKVTWISGLEGAYNRLNSRTRYSENGRTVNLPAANVVVEELRSEGFLTRTWTPRPEFSLEAALRFEVSRIESKGDVVLSKTLSFAKPRLAITWTPEAGRQWRARIEREVGQLDFNDFVASQSLNTGAVFAGNPNLNPYQALVAEVSYEQKFWKDGSVTLTLTHTRAKDTVDRSPIVTKDDIFDAPANIGSGTKDEAKIEFSMPLARLGLGDSALRGATTWRRSEVTDPTTRLKRPLSDIRPLQAELHFTQNIPKYRISWGVNAYNGSQQRYYRYNEIETQTREPELDLFLEYKPQPKWSLRIEVINITSRHFGRTREVYSGLRGSSPLQFRDEQDTSLGSSLFFRIRRSLG